MKVVITGGLGFIFSEVAKHLSRKGYEVHVIDNLSEGSHPELIGKFPFTFHKLNVANSFVIGLIKKINPEYIIHASAISCVDTSIRNPLKTIRQNCDSTLNVFEVARTLKNLKKLVYISTDEVYGECEIKKEETDILFPKNPYACSKAFGSVLRLSYDNTFPELKDKTAETRFCNVFGGLQDKRKILGRLKDSLKTGEPVPVHNGGLGYREYIYVKNIPPIVEEIMLKGDRTYNITLNDGFKVGELIKKVEEITGHKFKVEDAKRPGMDLKYQMSNERVKKEFNWTPEYSFEDGIKEYFND